jgi:uncharacterized RDD family membrane protein YckC
MATPPNNSSSASGGKDSPQREIILARWSERFIAWLIDVVIVYVGLAILFALISIPFWIYFGTRGMDGLSEKQFEPFHYIVSSLVFLAYWTYFESTSGQSIGKRVMSLKTTTLDGNLVDRKRIALSAFGKAFLLPIDVILGWIFTNEKRQRIFSRASDTIVVKIKKEVRTADNKNIKYIKD